MKPLTTEVPALLIDGPRDGERIIVKDVLGFLDFPSIPSGLIHPMVEAKPDPPRNVGYGVVRYKLYDDWPVKYIFAGIAVQID